MRFIFLLTLFVSGSVAAQSALHTTFSGTLRLDHGVAERDYPITVEVRKHSLEIRETCIFVITGSRICFPVSVYPIEQRRSKTVTLIKGGNAVSFGVSGVERFGIKYSVKLTCGGCTELVPIQYFTPSGNTFSSGNSSLLDTEEIPTKLNVELITRTIVSGAIMLPRELRASKNLNLLVTAYELPNETSRLTSPSTVVLPKGESQVEYRLSGLPSGSVGEQMQIVLECTNCPGSRPQIHEQALSRGVSHSGIDFIFDPTGPGYMVPVLDLLFENNVD